MHNNRNLYLAVFILINKFFAKRECRELFFLFGGVTLTAIFAVNTGGMIKPANHFLWGGQIAPAFIILYPLEGSYCKCWK